MIRDDLLIGPTLTELEAESRARKLNRQAELALDASRLKALARLARSLASHIDSELSEGFHDAGHDEVYSISIDAWKLAGRLSSLSQEATVARYDLERQGTV